MKGTGFMKTLPMIPGSDVAGTVVAVAPDCHRLQVGNKVMGKIAKAAGGTMAEYCSIDENLCVLKPENLSSSDAASMPLAGMTALQALKKGKVASGQKVLIIGSGGVGCHAIQIARAYGCSVWTICSPGSIDWVLSLGASNAIDYNRNWAEELKGQNFDIIVDTVGGSWEKAQKVAKTGSRFVTIVGDEPQEERWSLLQLAWTMAKTTVRKALTTTGGPHYYFILTKDKLEDLQTLANMVSKGQLKPCVDKVFPFDLVMDAFKYCMQGHPKGKVVVWIGPGVQAM
jgi:NADPH:quinone reductase-like Zn-dependent oxidoreductase